jgi:hypothetical protein
MFLFNAAHADLYDKIDVTLFDRLSSFLMPLATAAVYQQVPDHPMPMTHPLPVVSIPTRGVMLSEAAGSRIVASKRHIAAESKHLTCFVASRKV